MFKYDTLALSLQINKTHQHKNKCLLLTTRFKKGRYMETQIEHTRLSFLDRQSSDQNFSSRGIMIDNHRNKTTES
jgi:hypothetical protein